MLSKRKSKPVSEDDFLVPEDRALFERVFDIADLGLLDNLLEEPPETDEIPEIEFAYDMRPPGGRSKGHLPHLACVFRHSARHWQGWIVRWKNGDRARLGPDCGEKHFGFDIKKSEDRFKNDRTRHNDLARAVVVRRLLPGAVAELQNLVRDPAVADFDELRQQFRSLFPQLHTALGEVTITDRVLMTSRLERDYTAEEKRAEEHSEGKRLLAECTAAESKGPGVLKACNHRFKQWKNALPPIMKVVTHNVGTLAGGSFPGDPRPMAQSALAAWEELAKIAQEFATNLSDHWNARHPFSQTFKEAREVIDRIDDMARRFEEAHQFSGQRNFERVAAWSHHLAEASPSRLSSAVKSQGRYLVTADGTRWTFPASLTLPAVPQIEELRRALNY